jgi:hypothetical protein
MRGSWPFSVVALGVRATWEALEIDIAGAFHYEQF